MHGAFRMTDTRGFVTLEPAELDDVEGAGWKRVVGRLIPGVNAAFSLYEGYSTYQESRSKGKTVGDSLLDAAGNAIRDVTFYDLWGSTPAY